jgi:hypothetical protein
MTTNLEQIKNEMAAGLEQSGLAVFYCQHHVGQPAQTMRWDHENYPDPRMFLDTARKAGVKIVSFQHRDFIGEAVDQALSDLEETGFPREQQRDLERRLRHLREYEGLLCNVEMSFLLDGVRYIYQVFAPWFDEYLTIISEIQDALEPFDEDDEGEDPDRGPLGGYFSHN